MMLKALSKFMLLLPAFLVIAAIVALPVLAQPEDPSAKFIGEGATYYGISGSNWYEGFVIAGQSGNYILNISLTGGSSMFPVTDIRVIVAASDEAAGGGLKNLVIDSTLTIEEFTLADGPPSYYQSYGGPFAASDYYGYNDTYTMAQLTYDQAGFTNSPPRWFQLPVTVEFASTATTASKIAFIFYGIDAKGGDVKTAYSESTTFVIPEVASTITGLTAMGGACAFYVMKRRRNSI